jgi:RNA polymerase sigma factor (sigma-70 family)
VVPADLYTPHKDTIEAALAAACRTHRLAPDVADEFCSWARLRLLDHDQAILRKFEGRSSLRTFLLTVVQRLYLDWRNAEWGKWRPSAEAQRLGPVAIELERLVLRDRLSYGEAAQTLAARGLATEAVCDAVWVRLPQRPRRRRVAEAALAGLPAHGQASDGVDHDEEDAEAQRVGEALERALLDLPPTDRLLIQLRYWSGFQVSRIARLTGEDQKALYRRFERLTAQLKQSLGAQGVSASSIAAVARSLADVSGEAAPGTFAAGPSTGMSTGGDHD